MTGPRHRPLKARLDRLLVERALAPTRTRAQALILAGRVRSGARTLDKPGMLLPLDVPLQVLPGPRWVGRGAEKLAGVLPRLALDVRGKDALDVGASTGGFTQVLLEAGARRVIALDVGRGQLDWSLRCDARVVPLEGINARDLRPEQLPFPPEVAVVDVSFISAAKVVPAVMRCLVGRGDLVVLVKPQFEVGPRHVERGGIVRNLALHRQVLASRIRQWQDAGWVVRDVRRSPVRGARGNVEYFVHLLREGPRLSEAALEAAIVRAVSEAEP